MERMACCIKIMYTHACIKTSLFWLDFTLKIKKNPNMEVFSFVFHFPFPILFPTDMLKFFSEKTNKAKQKLIVIFQDNKKVIVFSGGDDHFEQFVFQRENPTANEKDVLCSLSMLELTDRKLRPWVNMIPRWFVLKSKSDDYLLLKDL